MPRNDLLVWIDLEMTSVKDALVDRITEIAVVLTDADLNVVAEGPNLVVHVPESLIDRVDLDYREVYEKNGLRELVAESVISAEEAERQVLAFLTTHVTPQSAPLCGNSIHMDRHFLRLQMPTLEKYLHYRCIDVSSIKELARRWHPEVYAEARAKKGATLHRALSDIYESIDELRLYRTRLFH